MGTTLTGTTPQDTYDSLIKVTDNGPLSGTAKYLSDGLGNDSVLALSTAGVGIGTASPSVALEVDGAVKFSTSGAGGPDLSFGNIGGSTFINNIAGARNYYGAFEHVFTNTDNSIEWARINSTGNVGIGTDAPTEPLHVVGDARVTNLGVNFATQADARIFVYDNSANSGLVIQQDGASGIIAKFNGNGGATKVRIDADGLKFNADTAAANALDDYEEGTFTPTIIGSSSAGTATYGGGQAGSYTKIGRMVYFNIYLGYSGGTGTGDLRIAGLPFTIASADIPSFSIGTFLNVTVTASNVPITSGVGNSNQVRFDQIPTGGGTQTAVPYDDAAVIAVSGCYQV